MSNNDKKHTILKACLNGFARNISSEVIREYGASYDTQREIRNTWRDNYKYTPEIEKFLIRNAKLFIKTLDADKAYSSDLGFLHALIQEITDYLSRYTMRKNPNMSRKQAIKELYKILWEENAYVNTLRTTQAENRFARKSPKYAIKKRREEKRQRAKQDWDIAQQVKYDVFIEEAYQSRKR